MLALTRYEGEVIVITCPNGETLEIHVAEARGRVKLAFDAPKPYQIGRKETMGREDVTRRNRHVVDTPD